MIKHLTRINQSAIGLMRKATVLWLACGLAACTTDENWPNLADPIERGEVVEPRATLRLSAPGLQKDGIKGALTKDDSLQSRVTALQDSLTALKALGPVEERGGATWLSAQLLLTRVDQARLALARHIRLSQEETPPRLQNLLDEAQMMRNQWAAKLGTAPAKS